MNEAPELRRVPLAKLRTDRTNYSRDVYGDVDALALDIAQTRWVAPLLVVEDGDAFQVVAGMRRAKALRLLDAKDAWPWPDDAGARQVPVEVFPSLSAARLAALNVAENTRLAPNVGERFRAIHELSHTFNMSNAEVAAVVQQSPSYVANCARAWRSLHPEILSALCRGDRRWPIERLLVMSARSHEQQLAAWHDKRKPLRKRKLRTRAQIARAQAKLSELRTPRARAAAEALAWVLGADAPW